MQLDAIEPNKQEITSTESIIPPTRTNPPFESFHKEASPNTIPHTNEDKLLPSTVLEDTEIDRVSNALERFWEAMGVSLQFRVDKKTDIVQVEVIDPASDTIVTKIPADEILRMAASLQESTGILIDRTF
ncbi:MAG: hypothetical protein CSA20_01680 [Deltaproteobacteria bacterium]|nr:MAG: hypothetical protein CSA20_01680 [Deltaproteobacteria bacterium]